MGSLFGGTPQLPVPAMPSSAPTAADAAVTAAANEERRRRGNKGRASTILTSAEQDSVNGMQPLGRMT